MIQKSPVYNAYGLVVDHIWIARCCECGEEIDLDPVLMDANPNEADRLKCLWLKDCDRDKDPNNELPEYEEVL